MGTFINIEIVCSDREEHRRRAETTVSSVPGLALPSWEDILKRDYHPWNQDRLVLDTADQNEDACFEEFISKLKSFGLV